MEAAGIRLKCRAAEPVNKENFHGCLHEGDGGERAGEGLSNCGFGTEGMGKGSAYAVGASDRDVAMVYGKHVQD
jgi:hypothetical protein